MASDRPLSSDGPLNPQRARLTERQEGIARELRFIDGELEGLFRNGLELAERFGEPGVAYLLAHAGRELSRGLVRRIGSPRSDSDSTEQLESHEGAVPETERNRRSIARALDLAPDDTIVTEWFQLHHIFCENCHFESSNASPYEIADAFSRFERLIEAVIRPFFDAKPELERLLTVSAPSDTDLDGLRHVLARRTLREQFLRRASHPCWLPLLLKWRIFANPPNALHQADGSIRLPGWPAGQYLVSVAATHQAEVLQVLREVPETNVNPEVWRVAAHAGLACDLEHSRQIANLLLRALRVAPFAVFGRDAVPFAIHLAKLDGPSALRFVNVLLLVRSPSNSSSERRQRWFRFVDDYQFDQILKTVIPLLAANDPFATCAMLLQKLRVVASRIDQVQNPSSGTSRWWCRRIDREDNHDEEPVKLARQCYLLLRAIATDTAAAEKVCRLILAERHEIFRRLLIRVMADIGHRIPVLIDRILVADDCIDPPFGNAELGAFLRHQFANASPGAKRLFVHALERGPALDEIAWSWRHPDGNEFETLDTETADNLNRNVTAWQVDRLRWFRESLPPELAPLAKRIGYVPQKLTPQEIGLQEDGFYAGGGASPLEQDVSPKSASEMQAMTPTELVDFLSTWQEPPREFVDGLPSTRELRHTLRVFLDEFPSKAAPIVDEMINRSDVPLPYLQTVLEFAVADEQMIAGCSPGTLLVLASSILEQAIREDSPDPNKTTRYAARAALNAVGKMAHANALTLDLDDTAWVVVLRAATLRGQFDDKDLIETAESLVVAVGSFSGIVVETAVELNLCRVRREGATPDSQLAPDSRLVQLVDDVIQSGTIASRAAVGTYLTWIAPYTGNWIERLKIHILASDDLTAPSKSPAWCAYIIRGRFSHAIVRALRPVFSSTAGQLQPQEKSVGRSWSFSEHFAQHVMIAVLAGLITPDDEDDLLAVTFARLPIDDRCQAYWHAHTELEAISPESLASVAPRAIAFWENRLAALERTISPADTQREAKGLAWLIGTTNLAPDKVLPLAVRTLRLSEGELTVNTDFWNVLAEFAKTDPNLTLDALDLVVSAERKQDYLEVPSAQLHDVLSMILASRDSDVVERTKRLIHRWGEQGLGDLGELLT